AWGLRNASSKTISLLNVSVSPLWRGIPNFDGKTLRMWAMGLNVRSVVMEHLFSEMIGTIILNLY
ncbi:MAG: hypothetical protein ACLRJC_15355, partial [Emergencia timonensis]